METYMLTVNGQPREVTADPGTPLLWALREELKMTGTKYGCGIAACGACTVHLGGVATVRCQRVPRPRGPIQSSDGRAPASQSRICRRQTPVFVENGPRQGRAHPED